mgnify:CR=1 FL=1
MTTPDTDLAAWQRQLLADLDGTNPLAPSPLAPLRGCIGCGVPRDERQWARALLVNVMAGRGRTLTEDDLDAIERAIVAERDTPED